MSDKLPLPSLEVPPLDLPSKGLTFTVTSDSGHVSEPNSERTSTARIRAGSFASPHGSHSYHKDEAYLLGSSVSEDTPSYAAPRVVVSQEYVVHKQQRAQELLEQKRREDELRREAFLAEEKSKYLISQARIADKELGMKSSASSGRGDNDEQHLDNATIQARLEERENARKKIQSEIEIAKLEYLEKRRAFEAVRDQRRREDEERQKMNMLAYQHKMKNEAPLYERYAKNFEQNFVKKEEEARRDALLAIKKSKKPVDIAEIKEHEMMYLSRHEDMIQKQSMLVQEQQRKRLDDWKSKHYLHSESQEKHRMREEQRLEAERLKEQEAKDLIQRQKRYASLVREMYSPSIDPNLQRQSMNRTVKPKPPSPKPAPFNGHPPPLPEGYVFSPKQNEPRPITPPPRKIDYLSELREKNLIGPNKVSQISSEEKIDQLRHKIAAQEEELQKREKLVSEAEKRATKTEDGVVAGLADLYCSVIRTKLKLLQELTKQSA